MYNVKYNIVMSWADFIVSDLRSKIHSGKDFPAGLTLQLLSDRYGVSTTPVRIAVSRLIKEKVIVKKDNGRLTVNPQETVKKQDPSARCKINPPDDFFEKVARDLVLRSLEGKPYFLREESMAKMYNVSRTVLHRIFNRLAGAGVLDHIPRRGWRLRPFSKDDLKAFLQIREVLELKALELARNRLERKILVDLLSGNVEARKNTPLKINNSLHNYFIEKSANRYIKDFFEHHGKYYEILFACEDMDKISAATAVKQHRSILKALLAGNYTRAKQSLSEHIHFNHVVLTTKPDIILRLARKNQGTGQPAEYKL